MTSAVQSDQAHIHGDVNPEFMVEPGVCWTPIVSLDLSAIWHHGGEVMTSLIDFSPWDHLIPAGPSVVPLKWIKSIGLDLIEVEWY